MKASKKLIGASVALVAALAVSVGTTYAWFTTNEKVTVSNIEATVTTGDANLEVALVTPVYTQTEITGWDLGSFTYNLNLKEEIAKKDYYKNLFANMELTALTDKGVDGKSATTNGVNLTDRNKAKATDGSYITFYLAFRSPAEEAIKLVLDTSSSVVSAGNEDAQNIKAWDNFGTKYSEESIGVGDDLAARAQNAMRLAVISYTDAKFSEEGALSMKAGNSVGVWEPNANSGFSKGNLAHDYELNKLGAEEDYDDYDDSKSDKYQKAVADLAELYTAPSYTAITAGTTTVATLTDIGVSGYYYSFVRINIWVEGTDGECFNNIFGDDIVISLSFAIDNED